MGEGPVGKGTSERQMNDRSRQGHATPHVHFESGSVSCLFRRATDEPTMIEPSGLIAWVGPQCLGDEFELWIDR
jgi:hypothetical protein